MFPLNERDPTAGEYSSVIIQPNKKHSNVSIQVNTEYANVNIQPTMEAPDLKEAFNSQSVIGIVDPKDDDFEGVASPKDEAENTEDGWGVSEIFSAVAALLLVILIGYGINLLCYQEQIVKDEKISLLNTNNALLKNNAPTKIDAPIGIDAPAEFDALTEIDAPTEIDASIETEAPIKIDAPPTPVDHRHENQKEVADTEKTQKKEEPEKEETEKEETEKEETEKEETEKEEPEKEKPIKGRTTCCSIICEMLFYVFCLLAAVSGVGMLVYIIAPFHAPSWLSWSILSFFVSMLLMGLMYLISNLLIN
jgi:hypothetical protein